MNNMNNQSNTLFPPQDTNESDPAIGTPPNEKPDGSGPVVAGMTDAERAGTVSQMLSKPNATFLSDHPGARGDLPTSNPDSDAGEELIEPDTGKPPLTNK